MKKLLIIPAGITALAALAACGPTHTAQDKAKAAAVASAAKNNKTVQADKTTLENKILACMKTQHTPTTVVHCAFPKGDTKEITHFAIQTFQVKDLKPGSARDAWAQGVAANALAQGQK